MSPKLIKVAELAKRDPNVRLRSLAYLIDEAALTEAYKRLRKDAAVGVDGLTKEQYGEDLERRIQNLHGRMKARRYRHQPIRRVHIPKAKGKTRPIGISTVEDKIVQSALTEVLSAIYEQDFMDCMYGFRPGRSAHDALRELNRIAWAEKVGWILEADIVSFFDSIDRKKLMAMLRERIEDESFVRLVGKCLHVGVLDGERYAEPERGTAQGSVISPTLGNIYLHHVLARWFEREVKPRLRGGAWLIMYADDFVIGFQREDDARRVMDVLGKRFERFGLQLHPEKTRLIPFRMPDDDAPGGKGPATFDFLGFTLHWQRSRINRWKLVFKTRRASQRRILKSVAVYCRSHRHETIGEQHRALCRRLQGHINYFGVSGNILSLGRVLHHAYRLWFKWLNRRSQRSRLTWDRFLELRERHPLPVPKIRVRLWLPTS